MVEGWALGLYIVHLLSETQRFLCPEERAKPKLWCEMPKGGSSLEMLAGALDKEGGLLESQYI